MYEMVRGGHVECGGADTAVDRPARIQRSIANLATPPQGVVFHRIARACQEVLKTLEATTSVQSILLLQSGALGDCVLQLRIAQALRLAMPAARITWLGRDDWLPVAQRCSAVDQVRGMDVLGAHRLFRTDDWTDDDLARMLAGFDLIISGLSSPDSAVTDRLRRHVRKAAVSYETRPQPDDSRHICRQWLEQITVRVDDALPGTATALRQYVACVENPTTPLLKARDEDVADANQRLREIGVDTNAAPRKVILLHPGSGGLHKCYPIDHYLRLCDLLARDGRRPVMVIGPVELDRWGDQISRLVRHCALITDPPLSLLSGLFALAAAFIGNDSGPTHMAAAIGTPTLALLGPTDPRIWGPLGQRVHVLRSQEPEAGWKDRPAEKVCEVLCGFLG